MSTSDANAILGQTGSLGVRLKDVEGFTGTLGSITKSLSMGGFDTEGAVSSVVSLSQGESDGGTVLKGLLDVVSQAPADVRQDFARQFGASIGVDLASFVNGDGELLLGSSDIAQAATNLSDNDTTAAARARASVNQTTQEVGQSIYQTVPEVAGLAQLGQTAGAVGLGFAGASAMKGMKNFFSRPASGAPSRASSMASSARSGWGRLGNAGRAIGKGGVAGLATYGVRAGFDIEDDNSIGDSAMDVAEFALMGATVGSAFAPGIGTLIGGAVGGVVGVGNELYEYMTSPDENIGPVAQSLGTRSENTNTNLYVENNISPDLITTSVTDEAGDRTLYREATPAGDR